MWDFFWMTNYYLLQGVYIFTHVRLFVGCFVSRITRKRLHEFSSLDRESFHIFVNSSGNNAWILIKKKKNLTYLGGYYAWVSANWDCWAWVEVCALLTAILVVNVEMISCVLCTEYFATSLLSSMILIKWPKLRKNIFFSDTDWSGAF